MKRIIMLIFIVACMANGINAQRLNNKFSYSNLNGVTRIGFNSQYQPDITYGFGIDYISIKRNKNYVKTSGSYVILDSRSEDVKSGKIGLTYGKYFFNIGKRIYVRGLLGMEAGYEYKESKVIDDSESFCFCGLHVGLEPEIFISQNLVIYGGAREYAHYYSNNMRANWNLYGGLRISF